MYIGSFLKAHGGPTDLLSICSSFCNRLLSACATGIVTATNKSIQETYSTGKEFCYDTHWYVQCQSADSECSEIVTNRSPNNKVQRLVRGCRSRADRPRLFWSRSRQCVENKGIQKMSLYSHIGFYCFVVCGPDDYVGEYTQCDPGTMTRNLIYRWKQRPDGTTCTPGSLPLPANKFGLRCGMREYFL